jgi:hypothetical protein
MASTWVGALLHKSRQQGKSPFPYQAAFMINNPVRRALRDLVEPENFEFVEATGHRWEDVVRFRRVDT